MDWASFWAIFSQTHLVTLPSHDAAWRPTPDQTIVGSNSAGEYKYKVFSNVFIAMLLFIA
jgi:hypothetical protein